MEKSKGSVSKLRGKKGESQSNNNFRDVETEVNQNTLFTMAFKDNYGNNEVISTGSFQSHCNEDSQIDNEKPHTLILCIPDPATDLVRLGQLCKLVHKT